MCRQILSDIEPQFKPKYIARVLKTVIHIQVRITQSLAFHRTGLRHLHNVPCKYRCLQCRIRESKVAVGIVTFSSLASRMCSILKGFVVMIVYGMSSIPHIDGSGILLRTLLSNPVISRFLCDGYLQCCPTPSDELISTRSYTPWRVISHTYLVLNCRTRLISRP